MLTSIVGTNWGDEGKGRMVDLLSEEYDIVVRYQGGNNAGHTVINDKGKFVMNLMPSGICRENTVNILGPGIVIDLEHLYGEVQKLVKQGVEVTPEHLKISDRARQRAAVQAVCSAQSPMPKLLPHWKSRASSLTSARSF